MPLNSELADFLASFTDPKWEVPASRLGGESGAADFLSLPLHFNPVGPRPFAKLMNGVEGPKQKCCIQFLSFTDTHPGDS